MFDFLRNMIKPLMILVLLAFVATIIFSWGGGGFSGRPNDTVGTIDGENISYKNFEDYYSTLLRQEQQNNPDADVTTERSQQLREQAWNQLVADFLINREIEKQGITVTNREMFEYIYRYPPQFLRSDPNFMTDGKFDMDKFHQAMGSVENAAYWSQVERIVRPDLKKYKLQNDIISTVRVTPAEVMDAYLSDREKAKLGFVNIKNDEIRTAIPAPTEEAKKAYYEEHKEDYKIGRRATLDVVAIDKVPSEMDWTQVKYEVDGIYDSIKAGADFSEMAKIFSEDNSAANGGDLGWLPMGKTVPAFDSTLFAMNVGDVSQPVKTRFGWHIIKLLDKRTENGQEERHAAHILLKVAPSDGTLQAYYDNARELADSAKVMGLQKAAEMFNYEVKTTQKFVEKGYIQYIGKNDDVNQFAFDQKPGTIGDVIENANAIFVYSVKEQFPEDYTSYENAQSSIGRTLQGIQAEKLAMDTATTIYDAVMAGTPMSDVQEKFGFPYRQSDFITRTSSIPDIGSDPSVIGAAFALTDVNQVTKPIKYPKGVALITLLDKQAPQLTEYNEVQDSIYAALYNAKRQDVYSRWYDNMLSKAKIENNLDQFYSGGSY